MRKVNIVLIFLALFLSACSLKKTPGANLTTPQGDTANLLMNVLEYSKRPFVLLAPHTSGKLLTLYLDRVNQDVKSATFDIEYLAGNSLKGGKVSPAFPISLPHTQAFLLGSCSTGGKCSFDTNLISGTIKSRLDFNDSQSHLLKSSYVFVSGPVTSPDGRVSFVPKNPKQTNQILIDTQGFPIPFDFSPAYSPIAITSTSTSKIQGTLNINISDIKSVFIYDGVQFQKQNASITDTKVSLVIDNAPWHKQTDIVRDDLKGSKESVDLYVFGPIVLTK